IKGAAQAALDFKSFHFIVFNTNTFATEETFAEDLAHMFFGDYGSLTEKEEEISPYASNHLKELVAKRQEAFKALREHYGIATAIDAAPQTPNDLFSGIAGDNPLVFDDPSASPAADPSLDTGHYDDSHSFGWEKPQTPSAPVVDPQIDLVPDIAGDLAPPQRDEDARTPLFIAGADTPDSDPVLTGTALQYIADIRPDRAEGIASSSDAIDTGHYDDGHSFGWQKPAAVVGVGGLLAGLIALGAVLAFGGGSSDNAANDTEVVQTAGDTNPGSGGGGNVAAGGRILNTGGYAGSFGVAPGGDPFQHFGFIGPMPTALDVSLTRVVETGVITLLINGAAPFVPITSVGNYNVDTGAFTGEGTGSFTRNNIQATEHLQGTLFNGHLTGDMSINGLPNGPITFRIDMNKVSGP